MDDSMCCSLSIHGFNSYCDNTIDSREPRHHLTYVKDHKSAVGVFIYLCFSHAIQELFWVRQVYCFETARARFIHSRSPISRELTILLKK